MRKSKIRNKVKRGVVFFLVLVLMLLPCGSFFGGILTVRAENFTIRKLKDNSIIKNGNFAFYGSPLRSDLLYWIKSDGTPLFCVEREKHIIDNLDGSGIVEEFGQSHYLDEKEYELVSLVLQCCGMNHGEKMELHPGIYLAGQCAVWGITSSDWQGTEDFRKEMEKVYDHIEDWYETPAEEILVYSQETVDRICEAIENYYGDESPYIPSFTSKYKLEAPVWEVRMKQDRSCTIEFALDGKSESIKDFVFQTPEEWTYEWQDDRVIFYGENVQEGLISITGRAKEGTNLDEAMPIGLIHIVGPKNYSFFQRLASSVECETNWSCYFQLMVSESEEESTPSETEPEETEPEETTPSETEPEETEPEETTSSETEPEETKPEESTPSESEKDPEETLPEETKPSDEDKPSESKPDKPEESSPSETEPEETLPEETKPSDENKPSETEPEETKPSEENKPTEEETKPNETEPEETKPSEENKPSEEESKPNESEPEETKPSIEETEPTKPDTKPNPSESEETKPSEEVKDPEETEPSKPSETKPEESSPSESEPEETKPDTKPNPSESEGNKEETDKPEESKPNIEESKPSDETQEDNNKPTKPDTIPTGNGSHGGGGSHGGSSSTVTVVNVHEDKPEPEKKTIDENGVPQGETDKEEVNTTTLDENGVPRDKAEKEEQDNIDSLPKTGDKRNIFIYWITFMSSLSSIMFMGLKDKMTSRTSKEKTENKIK